MSVYKGWSDLSLQARTYMDYRALAYQLTIMVDFTMDLHAFLLLHFTV